ncbi:MAG: type II RES/Xre toxin-antitoxin system antitoxin [Longimicrobiales bacterium]
MATRKTPRRRSRVAQSGAKSGKTGRSGEVEGEVAVESAGLKALVPVTNSRAAESLQKWLVWAAIGPTRRSVHSLSGELGLAERVRRGYPVKAVEDVMNAGLIEPDVIYEIVVPRRTLAHRKQKNQPLSLEQSDRFARVLRIYSRAQEALGDLPKASRWLHKQNRALQGHRPIDLLETDAGSRAVEKVLGRIEHGIVS